MFPDDLIIGFDRALRTLTGQSRSSRPNPGARFADVELRPEERRDVAGLTRVNHTGEVCAQALYSGQALTAGATGTRACLEAAAREEEDHLAWTAGRLDELESRPSLLNPLWYAGSFAIGALAGAAGDRWSLGFVAETERQVEEHLTGHLERLPAPDRRTRAIVEQMRADEARHGLAAWQAGGSALPLPIRLAMRVTARVMKTVAYRI